MVQACCERCYSKYLSKKKQPLSEYTDNSDSIIDEKFLAENFGKTHTILKEPEEIDEIFKKIRLAKGMDLPVATYILVDNVKTKLCMCACHVHGINVSH